MKIVEKPTLPKEIFAAEVEPKLLAQAVRVHLANQRQGTQSVLTRAEVDRTRRKLYRQKGTGGARHGDRKAPIFVGGGVAFAPKPRDYALSFPRKMRQKALEAALTIKAKDKKILVVEGLANLTGKTRELASFINEIIGNRYEIKDKKMENGKAGNRSKGKWLMVTDQVRENVWRAGRNIPGVTILPVTQINAYEVMKANRIVMMEEAVRKIKDQRSEVKVEKSRKGKERVGGKARQTRAVDAGSEAKDGKIEKREKRT